MRSFQQVIAILFALLMCAFAQSSESYDSTVYLTSTVYHVNTVTAPGASPTGSVSNHTSTFPPTPANYNNTIPTGSMTMPSPAEFTGAASNLQVNALIVALAAGVSYLVL